MNSKSLRVLEYDHVKAKLARYVSSPLGKELVDNLVPQIDIALVQQGLAETSEARLISRTEEFPLRGLFDVRPAIRRAALGAMVMPEDLYAVGQNLSLARRIHGFFRDKAVMYPYLSQIGTGLVPLKSVEDEINACIAEGGDVLDSASDKLRKLRADIRNLQGSVKSKLESMVRSATTQKYLQETIITVRNDRYVLPVKAEYRGQVQGIVHDQSASGATLFIEPMVIVEMNNRLRLLLAEEEHEVERILRELSGLVGDHSEAMMENTRLLAQLDFSMAKGRFSYELKGIEPELSEQYLNFVEARHPLISPADVVPVSVGLGQSFSALLITGPNTGGKTVTLKTVGLLSLMAQSGLHIPAREGSTARVFRAIYADIGDEQSIEQSLSTFSSHMTNIRLIVDEADASSLVLLDELGAGTDPTEGAALAMSIVDTLFARNSLIVATTHYSELKAYAHTRDGVQNASMEFNVETLQPTYKLTIGLPGKSNAFEISERLGLDLTVIARAREYLSGEVLKVEDLLRSLEESRRETSELNTEAHVLKRRAEVAYAQAEERQRRLEEKEAAIMRKAQSEAKALVQRAKHDVDALVEELRQAQEALSSQEIGRTIESVRQSFKELSKDVSPSEQPIARPVRRTTDGAVEQGDEVLVVHLNQKGRVLEIHADTAVVQMGAMRANISVKQLRKIDAPKAARQETKGFHMVNVSRGRVGMELDLRGENVEEAILRIDKYLDDALIVGLSQVHLIHGKGTGALREGVREYLKNHPSIKGFRYGQAGEGGSGVTVVTLKDK